MTGSLIVFEGIDGAGTTTQIERYAKRLRERRRLVHVTSEPSAGPIGTMLRQMLSGRLTLSGQHQAQLMALLFAADRLDHVANEIAPHLRDGAVVLCDRYDLSSLAYQTATARAEPREAEEWVRSLNRYAIRPDVTVVIDTTPQVAEQRRRGRTGAPELYEVSELQVRLAALYKDAERLVPGDRFIHLDGDADADAVSAAVNAALDPIL
jgi:dTMP kinase